jgi:4-hydroxybenzoate polyprenyltransferase
VLGVAFGMGIPIAFAAVVGEVPGLAWLLMLGKLFWVLAYDTEYAMVDRDDDIRLGLKTSAITLGRLDVPVILLCYLAFIVIWDVALMPYVQGALFTIAFALAFGQVAWHYTLIRSRSREGCFKAFRLNHWLGFTLFVGIAGSYAVQ